jgi:hypothetical protein
MNRYLNRSRVLGLSLFFLTTWTSVHAAQSDLGLFESHGDVGGMSKPGSVSFNKTDLSYTITGAGANMWSTNDAFHFIWKRVSGDFAQGSYRMVTTRRQSTSQSVFDDSSGP